MTLALILAAAAAGLVFTSPSLGCRVGLSGACAELAADYRAKLLGPAALAAYQRGCELGDREACWHTATALKVGLLGAARDETEAARLFITGCEAGHGASCLGAMEGASRAEQKARLASAGELLAASCVEGGRFDCTFAALLDRCPGCERKEGENLRQLGLLCDADYPLACAFGGKQAFESSDESGPRWVARLHRGCDAGFGVACSTLASAYRDGDEAMGLAADETKASAVSERACRLGYEEDCGRFD